MRPPAPRSSWILLLVPALLLAGCSIFAKKQTKTTNAFQDERFNEEYAARYGCLIGSIVPSDPERLAVETSVSSLNEMLYLSMLEDKPGIRLIPASSLAAVVGAETYQEIIDTMVVRSGPSPAQWDLIRAQYGDSVIYVICGRIEGDFVITETAPYQEKVDSIHYETVGTTYKTIRKTMIRFRVFDIASEEVLWKADIRREGTRSNSVRDGSSDAGGLVDGLVSSLLDQLISSPASEPVSYYPEPTGIQDQVSHIFEDFAADVLHRE